MNEETRSDEKLIASESLTNHQPLEHNNAQAC